MRTVPVFAYLILMSYQAFHSTFIDMRFNDLRALVLLLYAKLPLFISSFTKVAKNHKLPTLSIRYTV